MYGPWTQQLALLPPHSVPPTLAPVFLLVLSLYTCLPLPTLVSFMAGLLVSGLHLFGLAMSGVADYDDAVASDKVSDLKFNLTFPCHCSWSQ